MKRDNAIRPIPGSKENPFQVPEGYFESLTSQVMNRLPEKESVPVELDVQPTIWQRIRPWLYMAAMFVGAALIINVASADRQTAEPLAAADEADSEEMEYIHTAVENSMLDDYSLYVYLADSAAE